MTATPAHILHSVFGYEQFRGQQADIIDALMAGQNTLVVMPTGSGKSLCYQIPGICRAGTGIVVSPLIALMDDQVAALRQLGVRAAALHSGLDLKDVRGVYDALKSGGLDLLYVSPERLMMDDFLNLLDDLPLSLFAIDEAHCISQWGHDFRPEYRQLSLLATRFTNVPRIAVTATADEPTRKDIMAGLSLTGQFVAGFDRPNIHYSVTVKDNPRRQLMQFLKSVERDDSGIIYCLSRRKVEETAAFLVGEGYNALPYHAGLDNSVRSAHQTRFLREEGVIMVATVAFGMGINKPNVRFVAHLDLPKSIEAYYQETGRAGRDGLPSVAWMAYGMQDVVLQRQMLEEGNSDEAQKRIERHKLNALLGYCETGQCRRQMLLSYFGDEGAPCNNCDTCNAPPAMFDATIPVQKLLSCVYRTGQRFGAGYVIDVLLGNEGDERIARLGHNNLSVFGIGKEHDKHDWQTIIRQLVSRNMLMADLEGHGGLSITQEGMALLKDRANITLRLDERAKTKSVTRSLRDAASLELDNDDDKALFAKLKDLRLSLAKEQGVPPYIIFHDKTLAEMARIRPATLAQMGHVGGVGQSKLERYGDAFLTAIRA